MKSFTWGHGIIVFFIFYIGFLVVTVIASRGVDHSLVLDDYYALDLAYQDRYTATANTDQTAGSPVVTFDPEGQEVIIDFGLGRISECQLQLYRPSDARLDKHYKLEDVSSPYAIPVRDLAIGKWIAKTQWKIGAKSFYREDQIYITHP